jgi:hypothetical protein
MSDSENIKRVYIPPSPVETNAATTRQTTTAERIPKKRVITNTKQWDFQPDELTLEYQLFLLNELQKNKNGVSSECVNAESSTNKRIQLVNHLIHSKWYGYRTQDMEKRLFDIEQFIRESEIVDLLIDSRLLCFYCRKEIQILYEHVRETMQWSVERIDNTRGHNRGNVVISCLGCNLRRKTMYYERFRMTKQLCITKTA